MDISLITSLYRAERHLPAYTQRALDVAATVRAEAGLSLELVIVANDATPAERAELERLANAAAVTGTPQVVIDHVPRETVYASWNRGILASTGVTLGPWNVDDERTAAALIEGHQRILGGCKLVYFPYTMLIYHRWLGLDLRQPRRTPAPPYDPVTFRRAMRGGSFILFARALYDMVGLFDADFRIAGDFEWAVRATYHTDFCRGSAPGGIFHLHGGNLSDTGNARQIVEDNIVHLRHGHWENVRPAPPELMRTCWEAWGHAGHTLAPEQTTTLWGPDAAARWEAWQVAERQRRARRQRREAIRAVPRFVINRIGLRPLMARLGVVKSATR